MKAFLNNKKMYLVFILLLPIYKIHAQTYSIIPSVTDTLSFSIYVKTNVYCFTCDYLAQISDPISVTSNTIKDQYNLESGWQLIPVSLINCHNKIMNNDMQDMLNSDIYPNIKIKIAPYLIDRGILNEKRGMLTLSIDGIYKTYELVLKNSLRNQNLCISGSLWVNLNDFGITPPSKIFNLITVENIVRINFSLLIDNANRNRLLTLKDSNSFHKTEINK